MSGRNEFGACLRAQSERVGKETGGFGARGGAPAALQQLEAARADPGPLRQLLLGQPAVRRRRRNSGPNVGGEVVAMLGLLRRTPSAVWWSPRERSVVPAPSILEKVGQVRVMFVR